MIAHGSANVLREKLFTQSDGYMTHIWYLIVVGDNACRLSLSHTHSHTHTHTYTRTHNPHSRRKMRPTMHQRGPTIPHESVYVGPSAT